MDFWWSSTLMLCLRRTYVGHLRQHGNIRFIGEDGRVVIDVLHSDDELRGRLQGSASLTVCSRCDETVLVLLLTVQRLGDMYVTCVAINNKHRSHSLSLQHVLSVAVSFVHICVQLEINTHGVSYSNFTFRQHHSTLMQVSLINTHLFAWQVLQTRHVKWVIYVKIGCAQ